MKITRRQLRRIIVEANAPDIPDVMGAMGGGKFQPREEAPQRMEDNPEIMDLFNQILQVFARQFPRIDTKYFGDEIYQAIENEWNAAAAEQAESGSDF
tara:strand:+ start:406 stop:699 length:294 start_codon:yes stop_codon:yes gene_type:complete